MTRELPERPTARPRRPTRARRAARRSAALALLTLAALPVAAASAAPPRFTGAVTDALRNPTHRLAAGAGAGGRAAADLVFADAQRARTTARACVRRRDVAGVRSCFTVTTGAAGVETVTPLRFPRGSWIARWTVDGTVVARWRFTVA